MANFTLTVGADTVAGGAVDDTVTGTAGTLNSGDSLTGGAGTDTLALNGGGTFSVDQLATFTGFEIIRLGVVGYQSTNLYLGSQSVAVIADGLFPNEGGDRGQNAVRVYLGSGAVTCVGINFVYSTSASNWNAHNSIDGGSIYLNNYSDGAYDLTTNTLSNINYLFFSYGNSTTNLTVQINSAVAVGISNFWASPAAGNPPIVRNAQLVTSDAALDLSHSTLHGFTVASSNATGTNFTVHDIATAYQITGGSGTDTITAQGFAFSAAQRDTIFATASVERIVDASGTYTVEIAPTITSNGGGDTAAVSIVENATAVTTVTATDPDSAQTLNYSISGGADAGKFTIGSATGALSFITAPNFEAPADAGGNNIYDVTVQASDGNGGTDTHDLAVTVQDVAGQTINGNNQAQTLNGSNEADVINGLGGNDTLRGLAGNDTLDGGAGRDTMIGGVGNDTYVVDNTDDVVTENSGEGRDTVRSLITYALGANLENLTLTGSSNINGSGNAADNVITGNSGNNVLAGFGGGDTLNGGAGVDTATYAASGAAVSVSFATGLGSGGDAEDDTLIDFENLIGSAFADTLEGNGGNNVLVGGAGIDTLSYEHTNSGVIVSLATTAAQNTAGAGTDTVSGFENLTGSGFGDVLTGSSAANVINGGDGSDVIRGGGGGDDLTGGAGNDRFVLGAVTDSAPAASDFIWDFIHGEDKLDFSAIDANTSPKAKGDQAFLFGGEDSHVAANSVTWFESAGHTIVQADVNGDATADIWITLSGTGLQLNEFDFFL